MPPKRLAYGLSLLIACKSACRLLHESVRKSRETAARRSFAWHASMDETVIRS